MPIRAYLNGQTFDGETIRLIGIAFEMALGSFGATPRLRRPGSCGTRSQDYCACESW
jgi:hypothetical protein